MGLRFRAMEDLPCAEVGALSYAMAVVPTPDVDHWPSTESQYLQATLVEQLASRNWNAWFHVSGEATAVSSPSLCSATSASAALKNRDLAKRPRQGNVRDLF